MISLSTTHLFITQYGHFCIYPYYTRCCLIIRIPNRTSLIDALVDFSAARTGRLEHPRMKANFVGVLNTPGFHPYVRANLTLNAAHIDMIYLTSLLACGVVQILNTIPLLAFITDSPDSFSISFILKT